MDGVKGTKLAYNYEYTVCGRFSCGNDYMLEGQNTRYTLLQKIQKAESDDCWEEFVKYYEGYIYVVIRSFNVDTEDSEELLQDVLVKIWKNISSYDYDKDKCRFRTWLCVVIRNTVYNFLGKKSSRNSKQNVCYDPIGFQKAKFEILCFKVRCRPMYVNKEQSDSDK